MYSPVAARLITSRAPVLTCSTTVASSRPLTTCVSPARPAASRPVGTLGKTAGSKVPVALAVCQAAEIRCRVSAIGGSRVPIVSWPVSGSSYPCR